jgi:hypothetical protein
MTKLILAAILMAAIPSVMAQTCDQTLTMGVTYKGEPVGSSTVVYNGLSAANVAEITKRGTKIISVGSQVQSKGGNYKVAFGESHVCDGKTTTSSGVEVDGVTPQGLAKILRQSNAEGESLILSGEQVSAKGAKRVWGKE